MSFTLSFGAAQDTESVKRLFADCGLPEEDTGSHIEHFLIARSRHDLAGTVGLEMAGSAALLRSLAVAEKYRGQGLAKKLCPDSAEFLFKDICKHVPKQA